MLLTTGAQIHLISDPTMLDFVETSIKGGYAYVGHRYFLKPEHPDIQGYETSAYLVDANNVCIYTRMYMSQLAN